MKTLNPSSKQGGAFLLEALIGILIFSMGILALVGLQAASVNSVSESKYRIDSSFLANEIIAEMWVADRRNVSAFSYPGGGATALSPWVAKVEATLPEAAANPPTIDVVGNDVNGFMVTVTLRWKTPASNDVRTHVEVAFIHNP
ncbi:MAG TPA: hypothetical protein VLC55_01475 [Burkholderiales bacterium]|nr:hypothetical protein [Burkholderiales bacterium]